MLDRRRFLIRALAGSAALTLLPVPAFAVDPDPGRARFVLVILRGALDGLHAVPPIGDPDYARLRGAFALRAEGEGAALPLNGLFGLHPLLPTFHGLWAQRQFAVVHAVATPYRDRSHFDAQEVLEAGGPAARTLGDGWLNRALAGQTAGGDREAGLAVAAHLPLVLRGPTPVGNWSPTSVRGPQIDFLDRLQHLYDGDAAMDTALRRARQLQSLAHDDGLDDEAGPVRLRVDTVGEVAAKFLAEPAGPRVAVIELGGWDSHAGQFAPGGTLRTSLRALDANLAALYRGLGPAWSRTVVFVVTEFGRTVRLNGSGGTDHGTGTVALLAGGAIEGGRVVGPWPGLGKGDLLEDRDLRPTTDLRSVAKGLLLEHLSIPESRLERVVFPASADARAMSGLVRRAA